jgi:LPXTG-site transpeptidase (sortase) family protein
MPSNGSAKAEPLHYMQSERLLKRILLIITLTGFAISPAFIFCFIFKKLIPKNSAPIVENTLTFINQAALPVQAQENFGLPMRLKIPKININTIVEHTGLTPDGAMDLPKDSDNAAWFEFGSRPGENGSAVIAGHYGWKDNKPSVFDNLYKLRKGDKLYIEDDAGTIISFIVRENRRYDSEADALNVFNSTDKKSHLNLVTCEGDWNEDSESYSKRLVIFTDKE